MVHASEDHALNASPAQLMLNVLLALRTADKKRSSFTSAALVVIPWVMWAAVFVGVLVFGLRHSEFVQISPNGTFCILVNTALPKLTSVWATIASIVLVTEEVIVAVLLYRNREVFPGFGQSKTMAIRVGIFTAVGLGAIASCSKQLCPGLSQHVTRRNMRLSNLVRTLHRQLHSSANHGTINAEEIAHFSRLSSQWWDEQGEFAYLHRMNPVRVQFIQDKLLEVSREHEGEEAPPTRGLRGLDVLDVGCGGGLLSESLARLGANTLGIDASESNVKIAKLHSSADPRLEHLSYLNAPAESLLESSKRYDVVCSMEVLEHVDNPATFLSTCAELVKPGGHLFLSTIARTPLAYFLTIFLAEDILRKVSRGTHTYSKFIKPTELVSFFQKHRSPSDGTVDPQYLEHATLPKPWISPQASPAFPPRVEAEVRGLIYHPLRAKWHLAPRDAWAATDCNYIFWVRKPFQ
ncbi:hypothetical protein D9615_004910 [Tricholomella constricta]|uniref:Ubiquinone biosynthesis O-methyltransferase, mitochondrial n=1 Tax=Tricholomella constricta TaxID=117010 RepID=A0A8H5HH98_9AGAR|nr:hypothetical protein D9615_004910 [Tricholomella constricta]